MKDSDCVQFLQWALPRLHMRWAGFRKVRAQVCKRIARRMHQLDIDRVSDYRAYLETHPKEWGSLDAMSHVTISSFYRDKAVFVFLESDVLPALAKQVFDRRQNRLRVWSVGSSSGEEPYTIALIWILQIQPQFRHVQPEIIATDIDPIMIKRAKEACYPHSSIKSLPVEWRNELFDQQDDRYCLKSEYRSEVRFVAQDVRATLPTGLFDLILCRNLVFTYFEEPQQRKILDRIRSVLQPGGILVIGIHEDLPEDTKGLSVCSEKLRIFRKDI